MEILITASTQSNIEYFREPVDKTSKASCDRHKIACAGKTGCADLTP